MELSVIVKEGESHENVASLLAYEIAKENKLDWSNVLYSVSETLKGENKNYKTIKNGSRMQSLHWWNYLDLGVPAMLRSVYFSDRAVYSLTDREIEHIWKKETEKNI